MSRSAPVPQAAEAFAGLPATHQVGLMQLRDLIYSVADDIGANPISEELRWGQPSYLSATPRRSTAIRLASTKDRTSFGLFFHCQSSVVPTFRDQFGDDFTYDGNRGILFAPEDTIDSDKLRLCISHALHYR